MMLVLQWWKTRGVSCAESSVQGWILSLTHNLSVEACMCSAAAVLLSLPGMWLYIVSAVCKHAILLPSVI